MSTRKQTTAIALTGAVLVASGAYALGSQSGDGSAAAADPANATAANLNIPPHWRGGGPPGLDSLADRLGVDESDLREALEDARSQLPDPRDVHGDFAEELAKELGIDADRVEQALERLRDRAEKNARERLDELAERLADRLGLDPDEVKEALDDAPFWGHRPAPRRP